MYLLLKREDSGLCPACCISSERKKSLSHCTFESCTVTSWLCGTRQGNCFYSAESCEGWKTGPWWRSSLQSLFLPAASLFSLYFHFAYPTFTWAAGKLPTKGIPEHQCHLWLLWPHSGTSLSVSSLFPEVIRCLVPLKIMLCIPLQSLTVGQTHHLLLALGFTMRLLVVENPQLHSVCWPGLVVNVQFLVLVGRNWIDPGSVWRGTEENQHWDGAHHRATSPFSGWANNWPWCQHSQCSPHPLEEVRVSS